MKMWTAVFVALVAAPLWAQDVRFPADLDRLAAKAVETVDVNLDGALLQMAGKFLSGRDPDEARVKALLTGLKGIYVKSFEFSKEGEYSPADVEAIRKQVRGPGWSRIVGVTSKQDGENAEIFVKPQGDKFGGVVILAAEPKELTVVNIVGTIDLDTLSELGGHFGVPRMEVPKDKKPAKD
jgi:hypothetical protein